MSKRPSPQDSSEKRRSTRLTLALPIKVRGFDALKEPFAELTRTVMVSCHGCKYISRNYVPKNSDVTLEIPRGIPNRPPREVTAKVVWIQRPKGAHEMLHIGLNFDVPGNVWEIPTPPGDWLPPPGEEICGHGESALPAAPPAAARPVPAILTASWDASEIFLMARRTEEREAERSAVLQVARAELGFAVEPKALRHQPQIIPYQASKELHESMEEALKASIERLSESAVQKIVERASQHMAEIVEEASKAYEAATEDLDARTHTAVRDALYAENGYRHARARRPR